MKKNVMFIKLDLAKACDKVQWEFLQMVLPMFGFAEEWVNWVSECFSSASFAVLTNGSPSNFFRSSRGLRQGCPLSSFLSIIMFFFLTGESVTRAYNHPRHQESIHAAASITPGSIYPPARHIEQFNRDSNLGKPPLYH
jgi:hypothetical protein